MPHSSGGGSHGGGFHSSGSHGGGSRGSSTPTYSRSYFPGATRYIYYDRHHNPRSVYAKRNPAEWKPLPKSYYGIIAVVWAVITVFMGLGTFAPPSKLSMNYDTAVLIIDGAGVLSGGEETEIREVFGEFQNVTGVTPALATVTDEEWKANYRSLENYAYDLYVNRFPDEKHWLIVYSRPADSGDGFTAWEWHGMQGDDTDGIITERVAESFGKSLQKMLTADSRYTVGQAVREAFAGLTPTIMKPHPDPESVIIIVMVALIALFIMGVGWYADRQGKTYAGAVKAPATVTEANCGYCGGLYIIGTVTSCPHCGAAIPAQSAQTENP